MFRDGEEENEHLAKEEMIVKCSTKWKTKP